MQVDLAKKEYSSNIHRGEAESLHDELYTKSSEERAMVCECIRKKQKQREDKELSQVHAIGFLPAVFPCTETGAV